MPHGCHIRRCLTAVLVQVALVPAALAVSDTLYVHCAATGANNGTTWQDAYVDLQDALDFARASGGAVKEIQVAIGTYKPDRGTGDRTLAFDLVKGVKVLGGWYTAAGWTRDPYHRSTLSGFLHVDWYGEEKRSRHVVTADATTDAETVLDGFVITGGDAMYSTPGFGPFGGGVCILGSPVIRNCVIVDNAAV